METHVTVSDPKGPVGDMTWLRRLFLPYLKDPRDVVFIDAAAEITLVVLPMALLIFLLQPYVIAIIAVPYLGFAFARYAGRYTLMLHAIGHRKTFKHMALHYWISLGLAPLFGHTPGSFFAHHVGMHHPENNLEPDLSSTMAYQRDKFSHFLHYWARFFFFGYPHMFTYFRERGRTKLLRQFVLAEVSWFTLLAVALWVNPAAAFVVLVLPFLLMRFVMMCGNWAQHAFVDIDEGGNAYRNSTCLINARYNHFCFNDGYHIVHHLKPTLHWAEMPGWFEDRQETFLEQDAIIFDGVNNNQVIFWWLMRGQYDKLADHIWEPGKATRSHAERVEWLKSRVQRRSGEMKGLLEFRESTRSPSPA